MNTGLPLLLFTPFIPAMKVFVCCPVPMRIVLASSATPSVTDVDIVIAGGEIGTGSEAQCNVVLPVVLL